MDHAMSQIALKDTAARSSRLRAVPVRLRALLEWLRHAKVAVNLPYQSAEDLSDRLLRDIGGEPQDIARAIDRELGRLGLLDIGWQKPRRPSR
jgi:hypothetical protein